MYMGAGESAEDARPPATSVFHYTRTAGQQEAVKLYWVKNAGVVYGSISGNILREVCSYLNGSPLLVSVLSDKLQCFNCTHMYWEPPISLSTTLDVDQYTASVLVGAYEVFAVGGGSYYYRAYLISAGQVTKLNSMSTGRQFPGLFYDASWKSVLVFGGSSSSND